jgi:Ca2+-binding RTX toxin-like protein
VAGKVVFTVPLSSSTTRPITIDFTVKSTLASGNTGRTEVGENDISVVIRPGQKFLTFAVDAGSNFDTLKDSYGLAFSLDATFAKNATLVGASANLGASDITSTAGAAAGVPVLQPPAGQLPLTPAAITALALPVSGGDNTSPPAFTAAQLSQLQGSSSDPIRVSGAPGDVVVLANPSGANTSSTWWRDPAADTSGFKAYKSTDGANVTTVLVADAVEVGTQLTATSGSNTFVSGPGNDTIQGGSGVDQLDLTSRLDASGQMVTVSGGMQVDLAQGTLTDTVVGGFGSDRLQSIENVKTGPGNDSIVGSSVANLIEAGNGNNTIDGGAGADTVTTGTGTIL